MQFDRVPAEIAFQCKGDAACEDRVYGVGRDVWVAYCLLAVTDTIEEIAGMAVGKINPFIVREQRLSQYLCRIGNNVAAVDSDPAVCPDEACSPVSAYRFTGIGYRTDDNAVGIAVIDISVTGSRTLNPLPSRCGIFTKPGCTRG